MSSRAKQKNIHLNGYRDHRELYLKWLSGAKIELCKSDGQCALQEFPDWEPGLIYKERVQEPKELEYETMIEKKELLGQIGYKIRMRRNEMEMSQSSLRKRTGLSSTNLAGIEQGITNSTIHTLFKISKALGCEVADLIPRGVDV